MWPSERAKARAPVEVDISRWSRATSKVVEWRGKPVWVVRRTKEMVDSLKAVQPSSPIRARALGAAGLREERARARASPNSW
jgi:Rieske Fe-S protein